ncbi:MAG TPA: ATP-binding protein [Treponemataceae bacterium]|jgi:uncharacterized protein|nr:ATP-binding protein [Treponemataceae bacterium]HOS30046.1 ATP-binding protein [Treponemataceae bacterium]HQL05144.1 ATP-binding protein [Treponemataceae bacterium]
MISSDYINRDYYVSLLSSFRQTGMIKIITGIRRCGKSTLLNELFYDYLLSDGVKKDTIIKIHLESLAQEDYTKDVSSLYNYIKSLITQDCLYYIFIDEVQELTDFEKLVNALKIDFKTDIYLTGSNSRLLSKEISTRLSGRFVEIPLFPFSFLEFCDAVNLINPAKPQSDEELFNEYLLHGGFPFAALCQNNDLLDMQFDGLFSSVIVKDIASRYEIRDMNLLRNIVLEVFSSIGSITSPNKLANTLISMGYKVTYDTVRNYLEYLCDAFILYKASRYNVKGKKYFENKFKYYVVDTGLRNSLLHYRQIEPTHAFENIVYFELLRRGWTVDIGEIDGYEVDFMCRGTKGLVYVQSAWTISDEEKMAQECKSFSLLRDNYPKVIITRDSVPLHDAGNGILVLSVLDFLRGKSSIF